MNKYCKAILVQIWNLMKTQRMKIHHCLRADKKVVNINVDQKTIIRVETICADVESDISLILLSIHILKQNIME